jgi:hypothetical protein
MREVAVAVVHRLELAAVDCDDALGQQLELPAQCDETTADVADALAVVMAEVGDGLEVGARRPVSHMSSTLRSSSSTNASTTRTGLSSAM